MYRAGDAFAKTRPREIVQARGNTPGLFQGAHYSLAHRFPVAGIDQITQFAVKQGLPTAVELATHHWHPAGKRFQEHEAEAFAPTWHGEHVGQAEIVGFLSFGYEAGKDHVLLQAKRAGFRFEPRPVIAVAGRISALAR